MSLTRETLMKMKKDILTGIVLDYNEKFDSTLSAINDELKELKKSFHKLENDLAIGRNVYEKLRQQLILVEERSWENQQYSRRECLEITGIPESIQDDDLEDYVFKIFNVLDTPVDPENIKTCHRLKSKARPKNVIIKFSKKKDVFSIL